jgi:nitroreductase
MHFGQPITDLVRQRFSCRTYREIPIEPETRQKLEAFLSSLTHGPLGAPLRLELIAASEEDRAALRGLGTYGFIRGATGFLAGAVREGGKNLEDFGYRMEEAILFATALDLGTCWLGGTFTKSNFADKLDLGKDEIMPAVTSIGYISEQRSLRDRLIRRGARAHNRRPWERLFFDREFGTPLSEEAAGDYAVPLEMVRLGPSASNRQPWRIIRDDGSWHFYLRRSAGYGEGISGLFMTTDLQRVDMGIAMSHFALTSQELGLAGAWRVDDPGIAKPTEHTEYVISWIAGGA